MSIKTKINGQWVAQTGNVTQINHGNFLEGTDVELKESGKAADAKAVGDALAEINSILNGIGNVLDSVNGVVV